MLYSLQVPTIAVEVRVLKPMPQTQNMPLINFIFIDFKYTEKICLIKKIN